MAIPDVEVPGSDGWWLQRCYLQLRQQQEYCQGLWDRYRGEPPLPYVSDIQRDAVKWFVKKSRTNFEALIVKAVLARLRIRGIRTAASVGQGADTEAFATWRRSRGKRWSAQVHKYALSMSRGYVIVGKDPKGNLLVTAEDPRQVTAIVDPADETKVLAGLKLIYDEATNSDVAYLYLPGRVRVARRDRKASYPMPGWQFHPQAFNWSVEVWSDDGSTLLSASESSDPEWLAETATQEAMCCIVPFYNEDWMAEFEPHQHLLDRINQQILQRMTIATIQAFKQRAVKGVPRTDPKTGEEIDYSDVFVADPGAIWHLPATAEIWESDQVDLQPILLAIRDDVKDLAAVSGTPLYTVTPDVANGSAEGASLQRETMTFKVEDRQDRFEASHQVVAELMFRTTGDMERADPGAIEIMWAPGDRPSMTERANAIAQTRGTMARYKQLTDIWGYTPEEAQQALSMLTEDMVLDAQFAKTAPQPSANPTAVPPAQGATRGAPGGAGAPQRVPPATVVRRPGAGQVPTPAGGRSLSSVGFNGRPPA